MFSVNTHGLFLLKIKQVLQLLKPVDVKLRSYIDFSNEINDKD